MIRVAVVEDDRRYRASLETLFAHSADFALAETFGSAEAAITSARALHSRHDSQVWDIVLMDLQLPGMSGIEATRILRELAPAMRIVVITVFDAPHTVLEAICAGADGYLTKRTPPATLVDELRVVMAGGAPLSAGVARTVLNMLRAHPELRAVEVGPASELELTDRESAVLRCLVQGLAYKQIARELGVSIDTVRSHIRHVYSKLQVHSVAQAVSRAIRERLV